MRKALALLTVAVVVVSARFAAAEQQCFWYVYRAGSHGCGTLPNCFAVGGQEIWVYKCFESLSVGPSAPTGLGPLEVRIPITGVGVPMQTPHFGPMGIRDPKNAGEAVILGRKAIEDAPAEDILEETCKAVEKTVGVVTAVTMATLAAWGLLSEKVVWEKAKLPFGQGPELAGSTWSQGVSYKERLYLNYYGGQEWSLASDTAYAQAEGHSVPKGWPVPHSNPTPPRPKPQSWVPTTKAGAVGTGVGVAVAGLSMSHAWVDAYVDTLEGRPWLQTFGDSLLNLGLGGKKAELDAMPVPEDYYSRPDCKR